MDASKKADANAKIDELADLCAEWARNRARGVTPAANRRALLAVALEALVADSDLERMSEPAPKIDPEFAKVMSQILNPGRAG